jgi:two-component system response regulator PilR (NtrC family)
VDRVLVVDDELSMREFLEILLKKEGYSVDTAPNGEEAIKKLEGGTYDLVLCDIMMPKVDGMAVLKHVKDLDTEVMVIMITAFASTESAVEAMKIGAYDYITKPFQVDEIKLVIKKALEKTRLLRENIRLQGEVESKYVFSNIVGASPPMQSVFELIRRVAPTKSNVLILGESGTGKELAAKAIHYNSPRRDKPFVTVNCGAIPTELLESELFGHLKGSFTGAYQNKRGLFEAAHRGTVFLDEIGQTPPAIQVKLLRAIQEKTFKPVGGIRDISVDVRVIAASNIDLEAAAREGKFREDLFYRLNVIQIMLPPLGKRMEDLPLLARRFIDHYSNEIGKKITNISAEAESLLMSYDWPGNVRELENTIERAISLAHSETITPDNLPERIRSSSSVREGGTMIQLPEKGIDLEKTLQDVERDLIENALRRTGGVKKQAAKLLGISFRSFRYRLEKLGTDGSREDPPDDDAT